MKSEETFTVTATRRHGVGFVVPTFIVGDFGGGRSTLTCRDCDQEEASGHLDACPQAPLGRLIQVQKELRAIVERKREPEPSITFWTLCWWTAIGCALGAVGLIGILEWMK